MSDRIPKLEFDQLPASIADALRTKYERLSVNLGFGREWVEQVERPRYTTHALLVNCLRIEPPVPSIFADGYTGKIQSRTPT